MKFAQHVFSTDGAMHWSYCGRWEPTAVEKTTSVYYGMGYVLPKSRLPEIAETVRMVPGEDLVLRRMLKHKLVEHEQVCLSFEQFSRDLAMVDGWPAIWQDMFK